MSTETSSAAVLSALSDTGTTLATRLGASVVSIGAGGRGTGVVIAPDRVLTNSHHLRDRTTSVSFEDGRVVQGTVIGMDADGDLAVLSVPTLEAPALQWADATPGVGAVVFAVARGGGDLRVSFGLVSSVGRSFHGPTRQRISGAIEHSAPLAKGSSGGPVVDVDGRLVAITTRREGSGFSLARPGDVALRALVEELVAGRSVRRYTLGVVLASGAVAAHLRSSVGLDARPGLLVRGVAPGSVAETAGLSAGDLLVKADGSDLVEPSDLQQALSSTKSSVVLGVVRGDTQREVTVSFEPAPDILGEPDISV